LSRLDSRTMYKIGCCLFVLATVAAASGCTFGTKTISNSSELLAELTNPHTRIVLGPEIYSNNDQPFLLKVSDCSYKITILCENWGDAKILSPFNVISSSSVGFVNLTFYTKTDSFTVKDSTHVDLTNVSLSSSQGNGITIWGSEFVSVGNSEFNKIKKNGIFSGDSKFLTISDNLFTNEVHDVAIDFNYNNFDGSIYGNVFSGCGCPSSKSTWISIGSDCQYTEVSGNKFCNHGHKMIAGVTVTGGSSNTFYDNVMVINSGALGFKVSNDDQKVCANNVVTGGGKLTNVKVSKDC